jgi:hypothetical protein
MNSIAGSGAALAQRVYFMICLLSCLAAAGCATKTSDPAYCPVAETGYKSALADVNQRLGQYSACLGRNAGAGACAAEFSALRSAQSNLETSASDVAQYCKAKP